MATMDIKVMCKYCSRVLGSTTSNRVLRGIFAPKGDEVIGDGGRLHNEKLHSLYSSPSTFRMAKSWEMRWAGHEARIGRERNAYRLLVGNPEGKRPLGRSRRESVDNVKMHLRRTGLIGISGKVFVSTVINLRVP
jgi:hypothetical protein